MKKIILSIVMLSSITLFSQTIPTPEFAMRPYILEANNTLKNLERIEVQSDMKAKISGVEMFFTTFNAKSDVRLSKAAMPKFIIKVDAGTDPADVISLGIGEIKKDKRRFLQSSSNARGEARDISSTSVKLEFKKISDGLYEIVLPTIAPGEYAFMPVKIGVSDTKLKFSCFGVD